MSEDEVWEWMFQRDGTYLPHLLDLQEGVSELSQTAGSFRLADVTDRHPVSYSREMLWVVGCWELPDRISTTRVTRWVNPNYVHRRSYADIVAPCKCGAFVGREVDKHGWEGENEHTEACQREWRKQARATLRMMRKGWIKQAADLYLSYEEAAPRMGVDPRSMTAMCDRYEIHWHRRRLRGRRKAILTWRRLHDEYGYTWREIAEAFDAVPSTVRSYGRGNGRNVTV